MTCRRKSYDVITLSRGQSLLQSIIGLVSQEVYPIMVLHLPHKLDIPGPDESVWSDPALIGEENWFNAAMYLLSQQQRQQEPDFTRRQDQNNDTDCFLDRLALLFARKKSKETPRHVTATGLVSGTTELHVYIAKNGGPDDEDRKCRAWLQEWFQLSELKSRGMEEQYWKALLGMWGDRITYYKSRARKSWQEWDKELGSSKDKIAAYFSETGDEFDRAEFDREWEDTYNKLKLTGRDGDDSVWMKYYNFWKTLRKYHVFHQQDTLGAEAAKRYCYVIYLLEMLAMPMSIWKALIRFREVKEDKMVYFVLLDEVQLPQAMQSLQKDEVQRVLEDWNEKQFTNTEQALQELKKGKNKQTKYLHCELQILTLFHHISGTSNKLLSPHMFIGCSKLSCHLCWEMLRGREYKTRGTHAKISANCAFPLPRSLDGVVTRFVELRDRWDALFQKHKDGQFPRFPLQIDTKPAHTESNDFDRVSHPPPAVMDTQVPPLTRGIFKKIALECFRDPAVDIQGYRPDHYPYLKMQSVEPRCGAFAKVYAGQLNDRKQSGPVAIYALKEIVIKDKKILEMTSSEIKILKGLTHKNIVILEKAFFDESDPRRVYLATSPWAPETLENCLSSVMREVNEHEWCRPGTLGHWPSIVVQCLEGLSYLHQQGIKHKDIKPHNILLQQIKNSPTGDYQIRPIITDFNISKDNYDEGGLTDRSGTLQFKAPEQLGTEPSGTLLSDIWSLGCCFAFIFILIHSGRERLTALWEKVMSPTAPGFYNADNETVRVAEPL
ncbi:hypothetical protein F5Y10DRAFT_284508 [Nemania abortiva]|nr:hypothetical protein F5Y10DRAFT_284508 [Nemania abortiva]